MSIEIDIVSGDVGWPYARPLLEAVWPTAEVAKSSWGHIEWAKADLRVLVETPDDVVCHVGLFFRTVLWKGRKHAIAGIGGVATHPDHRRSGYASIGLDAAVRTIRDREAIDFALLFCEPHNFAFYEARGWHRFDGVIMAEQAGARIRFEVMTPYVFDVKNAPREGAIDLCGLPW
ncbi:MAG: acetyltransferase [Tardiphaga sp.]|nr:acetyltransferase [Tardiphaga sp.]